MKKIRSILLTLVLSLSVGTIAFSQITVSNNTQSSFDVSWTPVSGVATSAYFVDVSGCGWSGTYPDGHIRNLPNSGTTYFVSVMYRDNVQNPHSVTSGTASTTGTSNCTGGGGSGGSSGGGGTGGTTLGNIQADLPGAICVSSNSTTVFFIDGNCLPTSWTSSVGTAVSNGMSTLVTWPANPTANSVTITATTPCGMTSKIFTISPTVTPTVLIGVNNADHLCEGDDKNIVLSATVTHGGSTPLFYFTISSNNAPGTIIDSPPPSTGSTYSYDVKNLFAGSYQASVTLLSSEVCLMGFPNASQNFTINPIPEIINPGLLQSSICSGTHLNFTPSTSVTNTVLQWTSSISGTITPSSITPSGTGAVTDTPVNTGSITTPSAVTYTYTPSFDVCVGTQQDYVVAVSPIPAVPSDQTITGCTWQDIMLTPVISTRAVQWFGSDNQLLGTNSALHVGHLGTGTYIYKAKAITDQNCVSTVSATITLNVTDLCDNNVNSIETKKFDESGIMYSDAMNYFGLNGEPLQNQTKNFTTGKIFAAQPLRDRFERAVGTTLSAPIPYNTFNYHFYFMTKNPSVPYAVEDFDATSTTTNPAPADNTVPGTVGWYYGPHNSWESNVPKTDYPYSRLDFYNDGTGEIKRSASQGDQHRLGRGHEILSATFPVSNELDDYLLKRVVAIPGILHNGSLKNQCVQTVTRDQNGKTRDGNYVINITDRSGKTIVSARKGAASPLDLSVPCSTSYNFASPGNVSSLYFYLLDDQPVTITTTGGVSQSDYTIVDMVSELEYLPPSSSSPWKAGFYRIIPRRATQAGTVKFQYTNSYTNISYQFYDDAGKLRSIVSPNGVMQLVQGINYPTVDKTTYLYNRQGWLLSVAEPDAGVTRYMYRRDGKMRFSQNAVQLKNESDTDNNAGRAKGRFSYTNYDTLGSPVESGEYIGTLLKFADLADKLEFKDQFDVALVDKKDWIRTSYDLPDNAPNNDLHSKTGLPTSYVQRFVRGAVAHTENLNIQTWYSYDELGRVIWMAQKPKKENFPRTFVISYSYNFLGNVKMVSNLAYDAAGNLKEQFYHYYEYDQDKRLSKAFTSVDGIHPKLRATYEYYLHGPLKRIELGDKLQGIDFVYNINGWLTQINHPDGETSDPGLDGIPGSGNANVKKDVFGMVLDYYTSDLQNVFLPSVGSTHNPSIWHGLPTGSEQLLASHQPLIRFSNDVSTMEPFFKKFSAENRQYQEMILELKKQPATN